MSGALVIGVGPGIGTSVARAFARDGLPIGLIARSEATLEAVQRALPDPDAPTYRATADATDPDRLGAALAGFDDRYGVPDVLVYNAAIIQRDALGDLDVQGHLQAYAVNVVGAITSAATTLPKMAARGHGTFLITGGMPEAVPAFLSLSLGKAGVRALVEALDAQYAPAGVHVATVTVDGQVAPGTAFDPDDIAEHYRRLHAQPRSGWDREVVHSEIYGRRPA